ncbi:heptaprenylglyceryl phosphate synthase [Haloferax volcanii]|uniref:heptaprenylglyceryl phosphate synthase n=1 Tax=Haloferax volcanii TaxID=2246 RepID=UPI00249BE962|nr:heptaprenylglyceryl phosphate synthase [Haloferax alexandrinus]WEL29176.1 Phosphoglycerol geranylgeranyltransferase [Haloferax alexandrinus]
MSFDWSKFEHVTKVDPAKRLPESIDVLRHTDAVIVGGSDGVTEENSLAVFERLRAEFPDLPLVQEPYRSAHVSKRTVEVADAVFVPAVYNGDKTNFVEKHVGFFTELARKSEDVTGSGLPFVGSVLASKGRELVAELADGVVGEGYVVQNPDSKVAGLTNVEEHYTPEQVAGAALATESFYGFPIFYIEYSGRYGGPEDVSAAAPFLDETALLYGGGIGSRAQTDEILDAGADAVVVGDCFHEDTERFLETVPTT